MKVTRYFLEFVDPSTNSDKFYQVFVADYGVLINHGRRGTDGQEHWYEASDTQAAEIFANKKVYEKLDKGYEHAYEPLVFDAPENATTLGQFALAMRNARANGSITEASDDLASKAEEFASKVASLIASVKAKLVTESEILTNIQEMEADLERVDNAIGNARLGLEMARLSLGRSVG